MGTPTTGSAAYATGSQCRCGCCRIVGVLRHSMLPGRLHGGGSSSRCVALRRRRNRRRRRMPREFRRRRQSRFCATSEVEVIERCAKRWRRRSDEVRNRSGTRARRRYHRQNRRRWPNGPIIHPRHSRIVFRGSIARSRSKGNRFFDADVIAHMPKAGFSETLRFRYLSRAPLDIGTRSIRQTDTWHSTHESLRHSIGESSPTHIFSKCRFCALWD